MSKQKLGIDIGRGYAKGYTEYLNQIKSCIFKSVVAKGRNIDFKDYIDQNIDPIYLSCKGDITFSNTFMGLVAEKDGDIVTQNSADDKTSETVQKLLVACLDKLVEEDEAEVEIMLGVPNRSFKKATLKKVIDAYKGKTVEIYNHVSKTNKKITISDISIFRESDAALWYQMNQNNPRNGKDNVMVNVGFKTTEISFYDENLKYVDKKSSSESIGNTDILQYVEKRLKDDEIYRPLYEIDNPKKYLDLKEEGYKMFSEKLDQLVQEKVGNLKEVNLYICGGIAKKLHAHTNFNQVQDAQKITSKGLYLIATRVFK